MNGQGPGDGAGGGFDTVLGEKFAELFQGAGDAFFRGIHAGAEGLADFAQGLAFVKAEEDGATVLAGQRGNGGIEQGPDLLPGAVVGFIQEGLHISFLFVSMPAEAAADKIIGGETGGLKQPTGQGFIVPQGAGLSSQDDEDGLRDFLGLVGVADLAKGDGINEADVALDERGKGFIGMIFRILPQQRAVVGRLHSQISVRRRGKADKLFADAKTFARSGRVWHYFVRTGTIFTKL